jgi:hypothetical protein
MYQKKYTALGIQGKLKGGREVGMGRINESLHIVKSKREHEKVHNDSDDENGNSKEIKDEILEDAHESEVEYHFKIEQLKFTNK